METITVPATITQDQADCVGCTPEQYARIVAVASLFVPVKLPSSLPTAGKLEWPYMPSGTAR